MNEGFDFRAWREQGSRWGKFAARKFDGAHESRTLVRQPGSTAFASSRPLPSAQGLGR